MQITTSARSLFNRLALPRVEIRRHFLKLTPASPVISDYLSRVRTLTLRADLVSRHASPTYPFTVRLASGSRGAEYARQR